MKINRNQFKLIIPTIQCGYCQFFAQGKYNKEVLIKKDTFEIKQFCANKKESIFSDIACDDFVLHPFFFCKKETKWFDIMVCINRQKKNFCKCKQGQLLFKYIDGKSN